MKLLLAGAPWREELAWAAGIFDGEGNVGTQKTRMYLTVSQAGSEYEIPRMLSRLAEVAGFGKIYGPYLKEGRRPSWRYSVSGFEEIQAFVAMVWPWLGPVKREQAANTLREVAKHYKGKGRYDRGDTCKKGHPLDGVRKARNGTSRYCLSCHRGEA